MYDCEIRIGTRTGPFHTHLLWGMDGKLKRGLTLSQIHARNFYCKIRRYVVLYRLYVKRCVLNYDKGNTWKELSKPMAAARRSTYPKSTFLACTSRMCKIMWVWNELNKSHKVHSIWVVHVIRWAFRKSDYSPRYIPSLSLCLFVYFDLLYHLSRSFFFFFLLLLML